ncbi:MAG: peptidylprolyl isomerase [Thermoguttaceae bacterium]|jgi:cyclophilin family peptidyl-prolyl cis-trans isomerase
MRKRRSCRKSAPSRRAGFETLEQRWVLSGLALDPIVSNDVTLSTTTPATVSPGAPLLLGLHAENGDSNLKFSVSSSNTAVVQPTLTPQTNRSLQMSVQNFGTMEFQLLENLAPFTTGRIIQLAQQGAYSQPQDFFRVFQGFMMQPGYKNSGVAFANEFSQDLRFTSGGILAMANAGLDSNGNGTNDSDFFITSNTVTTREQILDFNYTIFGDLTQGESVRQAIEQVPVQNQDVGGSPESSQPVTPVVINSVQIVSDPQTDVLMLKVPDGATQGATANVTVTITDGMNTASETFQVTVGGAAVTPDTAYTAPVVSGSVTFPSYPLALTSVETMTNKPITFTIPATTVPGQTVTYTATADDSTDIPITVSGNQATVTPKNSLLGIHTITITATLSGGTAALDTFSVPLYLDSVDPIFALPSGTGGTNRLTAQRDGSRFELFYDFPDSGDSMVFSEPFTVLHSLTIRPSDSDPNNLVIDFSAGGVFNVPGGISFTDTPGGNIVTKNFNAVLTVLGGSGANTFIVGGNKVVANGLPISYAVPGETLGGSSGTFYPLATELDLQGGAGVNTYQLTSPNTNVVVTAGGNDTLDFSKITGGVGVVVDLSKDNGQAQPIAPWASHTLAINGVIKKLMGTNYADILTGNGAGDSIFGGPGQDLLFGGATGTDTLYACSGNSVLVGGGGQDTLVGGTGKSILIGGLGTATLRAGTGPTILVGGTTTYDANDQALMQLLDTWLAPPHVTRTKMLLRRSFVSSTSVPQYPLQVGSVVHFNGGRDVLVRGPSPLDLYLAGGADVFQ